MAVKTRRRVSKKMMASKDTSLNLEKISQYIKERAYYIWEEMGRPQGKDVEIWLRAEKDILSGLFKK